MSRINIIFEVAEKCVHAAADGFYKEFEKHHLFFDNLTDEQEISFWRQVLELTKTPDDWL